jgi:hypothetical protein
VEALYKHIVEETGLGAAENVIGALRGLFYYAMRNRIVAFNPAARLGLPGSPARDQVWTDQQIADFVDYCDRNNRASVAF